MFSRGRREDGQGMRGEQSEPETTEHNYTELGLFSSAILHDYAH